MDDQSLIIFAILVLAVIVLWAGAGKLSRRPGSLSQGRVNRDTQQYRIIDSGDFLSPDSQIVHVRRGNFRRQPLMNGLEFRTFNFVQNWLRRNEGAGMRVFAQVPLGEILACPDELAFRAINSKRIDLLVIDPSGLPLIAVEVQGGGHFQGNAVMRDAVKRVALTSAGVELVEVFPADGEADVFGKLDAARNAVISRPGG